jgi:hypothetical protein
MNKKNYHLLLLSAMWSLLFPASCSHHYDPDSLDLGFYQWNLWYDTSAEAGQQAPSCGWEDFHRGVGKLVRIPALAADHFQDKQDQGVLWYHCRFTLPENWEDRKISLQIHGAAPGVGLFLNEEKIAEFQAKGAAFELDVSDIIFYTRDNHLALKISCSPGSEWGREGISGGVVVKSIPLEKDTTREIK